MKISKAGPYSENLLFLTQEVGVLLALFCLFHATVGVISPSLARLRTLYVENYTSISYLM